MKKLKSKIIIFNIIFLFCFVNCIVVKFVNIESTETHLQEKNLPKLSNNGINIITPENITYSETMSGYYPATYGFENDADGAVAEDWWGQSIVESSYDGHNKVVKHTTYSWNSIGVSFDNQTSGVIEFYFNTNNTNKDIQFNLFGYNSSHEVTRPIMLGVHNGNFRRAIGSSWFSLDIPTPCSTNTWYHIRLEFNCITVTWNTIINGVLKSWDDPFHHVETKYISDLTLYQFQSPVTTRFDAIGFSWDPNYNIGDNLNEGLLLNYENNTALDWMGYSLDNQESKTILGNTTIPMPEDGVHTIQVFGNDTLGTVYQSDIRYFTVDFPIDIITPEAKTYNKAMDGYYPGIHGFENTKNGSIPEDWIFFSNDITGDGESFVIEEVDGHKNVIKLKHGGTLNNYTQLKAPSFYPNQISVGTFEWWMYYEDNGLNHGAAVAINKGFPWGTLTAVGLKGDGSVMYYDGGVQLFDGIGTYDLDTWHHFKLDFDCSTDKFNLTVDGTPIDFDIDFSDNLDYVDMLRITSDHFSNCTVYYDAFGYSWEPGYDIGDNLIEGLLLSFENSTALDWIGYSLDGCANRTIWGNTTIPLPHDGSHVIRVFGNDTSGDIYESNIRRFSVHHINIQTPEDKTYTEPMSGYYPASYGFENDDIGNSPEGWVIDAPNAGYVEVYPVIGGHNKIVIINDPDNAQYHFTRTLEQDQENGTIEYWLYMTDVNQINLFQHRNSTLDSLMNYRVESNKWQYRTTAWNDMKQSNGINDMPAPSVNTWYHVRIDFECGSGGHFGLNPDSYQVIIDGISSQELPFQFNGTSLHDINCRTDAFDLGYSYYVDAFGFSWDPTYNIGDNRYEGLLLSFQNTTALNWTGYSLDYQPVKTILGNTTFPMPENGLHTIRVFGNDSFGINYNSELRYFTVDYAPIRIITPENKTYTEPMSGYYPATYGFENDKNANDPLEWSIDEGGGTVQIIPSITSHNKIVEIHETVDVITSLSNLFTGRSTGSVEWWVRINRNDDSFDMAIRDGPSTINSLHLLFDGDGNLKYRNATGWQDITTYTANTWYHYKVEFDTASDWHLWINNISQDGGSGYEYQGSPSNMNNTYFGISNAGAHQDQYMYIDAVGYSWDPNYNIGDNLNEGLLLGFENSPDFSWIGLSSDFQPNKTILGNTTFPMLNEGLHVIQLFGNDTFGVDYQSDVRYFRIDFSAPNISINSPRSNELFGSIAPYFNITIFELNLVSMWYTIDAGLTNLTITEPTGMIEQIEWNDRPNGTVSLRFYANDTAGFFGYEEVAIRKDTLPPEITINSPNQDQVFRDSAPFFNISINEGNLDEIWYTLDDGLVNIRCSASDQILQEYWNALRPGNYILKFYANDSVGNLGFSEVSIKKRGRVISVYNPIIISLISITGFAVIIYKIKKKIE